MTAVVLCVQERSSEIWTPRNLVDSLHTLAVDVEGKRHDSVPPEVHDDSMLEHREGGQTV